ncbi:MAG TPA: hypothetical protein VI432_00555, partial [Candidatus Paceibacterota bacterium]
NEIMADLKIEPGPRLGRILTILLEDALDDPSKNLKKKLLSRAEELNKLSDAELDKIAEKAKKSAEEAQERVDKEIKDKYFVK